MRVFVTGSSGFVGRRLVARLAESGHAMLGADREHDVTRPDDLVHVLADTRPDAVLHLAARSSVAESLRDPLGCYRVNFLGTSHLLAAAAAEAPRARVVLVGSGDQYGPAAAGAAPYRESDPLDPRSPYARTKAAAEWLGTRAAGRGQDVVRVRAFNHTGAGQTERFVASSFARQVAEIDLGLREAHLRVGNLESVRDFLDVDDVIDAYLALLDPGVPAGVYNVASGRGVAVGEILETLLDLAGVRAEVEVDPERFRPTDALVGDASRLREATGWSPRIPLRRTLASLLDDWRARLSRDARSPTAAP
ncbi:MAG: GDP-mannose 4,6-dehydratase [Myxococcota bacterium]